MAETLAHDDITRMLSQQVSDGVAKINAANEVLLADESGTGVREIDKAFKEAKVEDKEAVKFWEQAEKARKAYKESLEKARNAYRVNVLGEDEVTESEVDKDEVKEVRKLVMEALSLLKTYAQANGKSDIVQWADSLEIPQVGRQGTSSVGQKKPRMRVSVNGTVHESFGEAAKAISAALSTDDEKVTLSSGDIVSAWSAAGEPDTFDFRGLNLSVTPKEKKGDKAA